MSKIKHNEAISIFQMILSLIQTFLTMIKKKDQTETAPETESQASTA